MYNICRCLPSDRTRHKVNDLEADYSGDLGEGEGRTRAEARTLLVYAGHRPKSRSKHVCLLIAYTGQQGPVLYKGEKGVNVAAGPHP